MFSSSAYDGGIGDGQRRKAYERDEEAAIGDVRDAGSDAARTINEREKDDDATPDCAGAENIRDAGLGAICTGEGERRRRRP